MIRYLIYFFLLILLIIATFLIVKVFKIKKSFVCKLVCVCVASVLLIEVFSFFSFEKIFSTFESPQSALSLYDKDYFKNAENVSFIYGDDSCMLYSSHKEAPLYLRRTKKGWKVVQQEYQALSSNTNYCYITVDHIKNTQDYYIDVFDSSESITNVSDNYNTIFSRYDEENIDIYKAYVKKIDANYKIIIDANIVNVGDLSKLFD